MRRVALTVLLVGVLALMGGGVVAAQPGHQDGKDRFPGIISLPAGFQPEGISIGKGTSFYVGSVANGAIYRGSVRTGEGAVLVPPPAPPAVGSAAGTEVDNRNRLWVAGATTGLGTVYDADSGRELAHYQFASPGASFINDVVVTKDAAYFTDSFNAVLYVVPIGRGGRLGSSVQRLALTGGFVNVPGQFNANGIEASPDGRTLLLIQSNTGLLFKVTANSGEAEQVDLGGATLPAGDGLLLQDGRTLYVVQNSNQISVVKLDRSFGSGKVIDTIKNNNFDVTTTVAPFGGFLYVVNARFGNPNPQPLPYTVVRVKVEDD